MQNTNYNETYIVKPVPTGGGGGLHADAMGLGLPPSPVDGTTARLSVVGGGWFRFAFLGVSVRLRE
jgi:hypothetical protein